MDCALCNGGERVQALIWALREDGAGYKRVWRALHDHGFTYGRDAVQEHCSHLDRDVMTAMGDFEDEAEEVPFSFLEERGIPTPKDGLKLVGGTIVIPDEEGNPAAWLRVKPEEPESERLEIRQAEPVHIPTPPWGNFYILPKNDWRTWLITPDAQFGYWRDFAGNFHTIHDERCFDLIFQVGSELAQDEGVNGWLDVGDYVDLSAFSRHNPTRIDTDVHCLNKTWQRGRDEFARRRSIVGPDGELVTLAGNHDIRPEKKASQEAPWLVGMRRPGEPDDEHPVLTVPYMTRARDFGVEWCPSYPTAYRRLNSNLVAFHSPAYGSKALESARKIAQKIHCSVVFGHTHRRESLAENIETTKGNRTFEVWSDGTLARIDGSLPSQRNTFDTYGDRLLAGELPENWGMLSEAMHQGFSIGHVEISGRERFSVERVAIWDGFCQVRGQSFEASCDVEGEPNGKAA